jgi:hypothetical protein
MKKQLFLLIFLLIGSWVGKAQTFSAGWYIVKENAQYAVIQHSVFDVEITPLEEKRVEEPVTEEYPEYKFAPSEVNCTPHLKDVTIHAGEVVFIMEQSKDFYFGYDASGRMLVFKGANSLEKAPQVPNAGVGVLIQDVELINGETVRGNCCYWIVGQDVGKSTITIQLEGGKKYEVPQSNMLLYSVNLRKHVKERLFETAK